MKTHTHSKRPFYKISRLLPIKQQQPSNFSNLFFFRTATYRTTNDRRLINGVNALGRKVEHRMSYVRFEDIGGEYSIGC